MKWLCLIKHRWKKSVLKFDWSTDKKGVRLITGQIVKPNKRGLYIPAVYAHGKECKRCNTFEIDFYSKFKSTSFSKFKKARDDEKKEFKRKVAGL